MNNHVKTTRDYHNSKMKSMEERKMGFNPMKLMQMQNTWKAFVSRHPKLPMFFRAVGSQALLEGTVLEIKVTKPDGTNMVTNLKLSNEDLDAIRQIQEIFKG